jgi:hypothetical protein
MPLESIPEAVASVMKQFDENDEDARHTFWDFYVLGGRWAGDKLMARFDKDRLAEFQQWLHDEKITVSSFKSGKDELSPASQIPKVDAKWNEMFPQETFQPCQVFKHSNDQYGHNGSTMLPGDICPLSEVGPAMCQRVIFAGPSLADGTYTGPLMAKYMLCQTEWNGVNIIKTGWDGTIASAVESCLDYYKMYDDSYRETITPHDDWLTVTVDYHD